MKSRFVLPLLAVLAAGANQASADVITGWSFDTTPYAVGATGQTVGSNQGAVAGTGYEIGWTTSITNPGTSATYSYDTVNAAGNYSTAQATINSTLHPYNAASNVTSQTFAGDIVSSSSTGNGSITENTWRVREGNTVNSALGFSRAAPQDTQGTQWTTNTTGYHNISFSFDWFSTNQAVRDMAVQYSTDGNNWNTVTTIQAVPNTFYTGTTPNETVNLPSAANNQSYLAVRLVTAYDSTGNTPDYASATLSGGLTQPYNNSSGNWRLDNLSFQGAAVPEPSTYVMFGIAGGFLCVWQVRRRRSIATLEMARV